MTAPPQTQIPGPRRVRGWPVLLLAAPAAVAIWSGWVGLGGLAGFGVVHPLPGIVDDFTINTAITLPIGMECYAAYAMSAWLTPGTPQRARRFARASAVGALALGALGQIAYHLMTAAGVGSAPWPITALVACLPVGVLGMGAALAHLLAASDETAQPVQTSDRGHRMAAAPDPHNAGAASIPPPPPVRPEPATPTDRTGPTTRTGPDRRRSGKAAQSDAQLSRAVRELAEANGGPPSQYAVKQRLGVGSGRAARLLAELDESTTPAAAPARNGAATGKDGV